MKNSNSKIYIYINIINYPILYIYIYTHSIQNTNTFYLNYDFIPTSHEVNSFITIQSSLINANHRNTHLANSNYDSYQSTD